MLSEPECGLLGIEIMKKNWKCVNWTNMKLKKVLSSGFGSIEYVDIQFN